MGKFITSIQMIAMFSVLAPSWANATPKVLVSIKPFALIAQEVAGNHAKVETLLPVTASPHDYPLKMSEHRRLREADLIVWVGPELESFLARPLISVDSKHLITAYELAGIHWPKQGHADHAHKAHGRHTQELNGDLQHREHEGHHHLSHHHTQGDPHLWLDPRNAIVIAQAIAEKLSVLSPGSAEIYRANASRFAKRTHELDLRIDRELDPIRSQGFAVYHEGYGHFVHRYKLHQVGYVTYAPERRPGAKHLAELKEVLRKEAKCLFIEPYYQVEAMQSMATSMGLSIGTLDPIGDRHISSYEALIENMSTSFLACLANSLRR